MSFMNDIYIPLVQHVHRYEQTGGDARSLIGKSECYTNAFSEGYEKIKDEIALEKMAKEAKEQLWAESLIYSPNKRLLWCKAIRFYESITGI